MAQEIIQCFVEHNIQVAWTQYRQLLEVGHTY